MQARFLFLDRLILYGATGILKGEGDKYAHGLIRALFISGGNGIVHPGHARGSDCKAKPEWVLSERQLISPAYPALAAPSRLL